MNHQVIENDIGLSASCHEDDFMKKPELYIERKIVEYFVSLSLSLSLSLYIYIYIHVDR